LKLPLVASVHHGIKKYNVSFPFFYFVIPVFSLVIPDLIGNPESSANLEPEIRNGLALN
jgi:hypothetical protein